MNKVKIFIDGACSGNPGIAGIGVVFFDNNGKQIFELSHCLGHATNNIAEYEALLHALKKAEQMKLNELEICSDSELLVYQMSGTYKVKDEKLKILYNKAIDLLGKFKGVNILHIKREENAIADKLAKAATKITTNSEIKGQAADRPACVRFEAGRKVRVPKSRMP